MWYNYCMVYLEEHLDRYPLMTTQDVVKLFMQGILGPAHLVGQIDDVLGRVTAEYERIKNLDISYPVVEMISDNYARVYLKPYFEMTQDFLPLVTAFKESAVIGDKALLYTSLEEIKCRFDEEFIDQYIKSGNILISHSNQYREAYQPHYLVVKRCFLQNLELTI
ncbi:MAG: hypothetical protein IKD35_00155 [Clostridia bacterium]|nr:hypothetical protein [Clostridia bacterium]